uniref:Patched family protein n=1 Tax=uncultured marine group II/III euryarchaeote KM3_31_G10 TaxID=1456433 RepID=A0A075H0N0_9EURY|nr:Patched family protein [uncultured marine group II/III euryarchaeote KM3_31_G10]
MQDGDAGSRASTIAAVLERGSVAILFTAVVVTVLFGMFLFPLPSFQTDLEAFAPEGPNDAAEERIEVEFGDERRPLFIHVERTDGSNILSIDALQEQQRDLNIILEWSEQRGHLVEEVIAAPDIIQRGLDESTTGENLQSATSWEQLLNDTVEEGTTCVDGAAADDLAALASFGRDALLHKDLAFQSTTCAWLDDNRSSGNPTPTASSTLWVFYLNPNLEDAVRQEMVNLIRNEFITLENNGNLSYGLISNDVLSYDINEGTVDNLIWLIGGALAVVIIILAIAFRSVQGVIFPLVALSMALVWTYGGLAAFRSNFSVLHVAVAPVVLGLGIDYSIHLQRAFDRFRSKGYSSAESWGRAIDVLVMPISLAVVTTVAAFISNVVSPLPPVQVFGIALAFGVICAFITSTLVVGAMHVLVEKSSKPKATKEGWERLQRMAKEVVITQRRTQVFALIFVVMLTIGSVVIAVSKLETEFDLSDFLAEDMEVMEVREDLFSSYSATGWRPIYIFMEPLEGEQTIVDDADFIEALNQMNTRIALAPHVITPSAVGDGDPMVESIHAVLHDAIEQDPALGTSSGLRVVGNDLVTDGYQTGGAAAALLQLTSNYSTGDLLTGATWSDRVAKVIAFDEQNSILYLRIEVMVQASSNSESVAAAEGLQSAVTHSTGPYGVAAQMFVTGDSVKVNTVLEGLKTSQLESTIISLVVSTLVLLALTRRIGPAIIVVTPVAVAAVWVVGAMAVLNMNWNVLTVMVTALTIGLGIDYSIHVWQRFESMKNGKDAWESIKEMHSTTGVALVLSALTTICGFLVLCLSPMPVIQDFGIVTALTVFFSLILALGLMPILLAADTAIEENGN